MNSVSFSPAAKLALLLPFFLSGLAIAEESLFKVLPPDKIGFNYPDPPSEGAADFFTIAENGEARCQVVIPSDSDRSFRAAVSEFAKYLSLATGAKIRLADEEKTVNTADLSTIHVGDTAVAKAVELALPDLKYGEENFPNRRGFLVQTVDPKTLIIRGPNQDATEHGLVGFLKRYVGIRQYWHGAPDGPGDVIPNQPTLTIPELEWRDWPYFASFQMSLRPFIKRPYLDFYRRNAALPCGENYNQWLQPSKYVDEHPEYYALVNGERLRAKDSDGNARWQPCVSNPEVQDVMANNVIEFFRENPELPGINVAINDGGGDCTCDDCRALDAPGTDYSRGTGMGDRYVTFTNEICKRVGKEFPDKYIVYLAYAAASYPPQNVKPHPRLLPVTTTSSHFERWDEWVKTGANQVGIYAHHLDTFAITPKMDVYQQAKRIRYSVGSGKALTYYMECHTAWPYSDVIPYVTSELLWDPRQKVETILDEYFTTFYGSAEEPMREYYGILTEGYNRWLADVGRPHWYGKDMSSYAYNKVLDQFKVLSPDEAARAAQALENAEKSAGKDSEAAERIEIIHSAFKFQKIAIDRAWAAFRLRDNKPTNLVEAANRVADAQLIYRSSHEASEYINTVLEQPPLDQWLLFRNSTKQKSTYGELKTGEPGSEIRSIISLGMNATTKLVQSELGEQKAAQWWRSHAETEQVPELKTVFLAEAERAGQPEPENLLEDPGFEMLTDIPADASEEIFLNKKQVGQAGVHLTFPDRTPYRVAYSKENPHSGDYSLMLEHCSRARLTKYVSAEPGQNYRAGFWLRQGEGRASPYKFTIDVRLDDNTYQTLSTLTIPPNPGPWQQFVADVETPPGTKTVFVRLHVQNQAADVRCWVDDIFITK